MIQVYKYSLLIILFLFSVRLSYSQSNRLYLSYGIMNFSTNSEIGGEEIFYEYGNDWSLKFEYPVYKYIFISVGLGIYESAISVPFIGSFENGERITIKSSPIKVRYFQSPISIIYKSRSKKINPILEIGTVLARKYKSQEGEVLLFGNSIPTSITHLYSDNLTRLNLSFGLEYESPKQVKFQFSFGYHRDLSHSIKDNQSNSKEVSKIYFDGISFRFALCLLSI